MTNHGVRGVGAMMLGGLVLVALAGCTASGGASGSSAAGGSTAYSGPRAAAASGVSADKAGSAAKAVDDRSIVVTGSLSMSALHPIDAADRIGALVSAAGGHLDQDDEHPGKHATADLVARIPSAIFTTTLHEIEQTGTVRSITEHQADVTTQVDDTAVRISALEASVHRLETLLGRASSTDDLVRIESSLTTRESDLDSLESQQKSLSDQVSLASLTIDLVTPDVVPKPAPVTFLSGLASGWAALAATGAWLAVAAGVLAPWVVVAGVLTLVAVVITRGVRRRRPGPAEP